jgi:hypothetical protein
MSNLPAIPASVRRFVLDTAKDRVRISLWFATAGQIESATSGEVRVVLTRHDDIATQWWADLPCHWNVDHWIGELHAPREPSPRLAELAKVTTPDGKQATLPPVVLQLEQVVDGEWQSGEPTELERQRLVDAREATFGQALIARGATATSPTFSAVMAVDNLLSTVVQRVPGMQVVPVQKSTLGSDVIDFLNNAAAQLGFTTGIEPRSGLDHFRQRRPAAVIHVPKVHADTPHGAIEEVRRSGLALLDLVALRRSASPRLLAGILGQEGADKTTRFVTFWVEGAGYTGNLLGGFVSGEDPTSLLNQWHGLIADDRTRLWLSLYSDGVADERWDYRIFRCFNLLEGIANEIIPPSQVVIDEAGSPLLQTSKKPYTTDQARGKVFELLKHVAKLRQQALSDFATPGVTPPRTLWDETNVWVTVRNAVAHRGSWEQPQGVTPSSRDQRVQAEITSMSHNGTFEVGADAALWTIRRSVEATLFSALASRL